MSPSINHSYIQAKLSGLLLAFEQYSVFTELSFDIGGKEYVPDICLYPPYQYQPFQDKVRAEEIPLLIIEILSPTQMMQELVDKFKIYLQAGVQSCWLVIPISCAITVFYDMEKPYTYSQDKIIDEKLGIILPLNKIFPL